MLGSGVPAVKREALVSRPLPLQAPTAFVRIRPHGRRNCGEGRPGRVPHCAAHAPRRSA